METREIEYTLIGETGRDNFNKALTEAVKDGWKPFGSHQVTPYPHGGLYFTQLLRRYKK